MRVSWLNCCLSDHYGRLIISVPDKSESMKRINCNSLSDIIICDTYTGCL